MAELLEKLKETMNLTPELQDKLKSMVDKYRDLDDEEKAEFAETVKESFKSSLDKYKSNFLMESFWGITKSYATLLVAVVLVLFVFVFFGYKLYKSLVERERKREEKKKLRGLKKKK